MDYKKVTLRAAAVFIFMLSLFTIFLACVRISNKSWMATLDALGGPYTTEKVWVMLFAGIFVALAAVFMFVGTFRKKS